MTQATSNPFSVKIRPPPPATAPSWVPPIGYFADVPMKNLPQDVTPAIYRETPTDTYAMTAPFGQWGGSAVLTDYSPLGAQVYYSAGHERSLIQANWQFTLICDFSTLTWSVANVPAQPNNLGVFVNGYAPDGSPYSSHSYLGLQEMPRAWGGGPKGSLASFFFAACPWDNRINLLDVSQAAYGNTQLATRQPQNVDPTKIRFAATGAGAGYFPIIEIDRTRQGWWAAAPGAIQYTLFISKSGDITQYPALGGSLLNAALVLCNSLNLLIAVDGGYEFGQYASSAYRTIHIRDLSTGAVTKSLTLGTVPSLCNGYDGGTLNLHCADKMGLQWNEQMRCIVGYDQSTTPPQIVTLSPPAGNAATGSWTWRTIPVAHWPNDVGGEATLQAAENDAWSKFRWVPALGAFVIGTARNRKPQVIRLS